MGSSKPHGDKPARKTAASPAGKAAAAASDSTRPEPAEPPKRGRCPICTAPTEPAFRPFCSGRCADVDLSRWLRGGYAIPGRTDVDEDGDDSVAASGIPRTSEDDEDDQPT